MRIHLPYLHLQSGAQLMHSPFRSRFQSRGLLSGLLAVVLFSSTLIPAFGQQAGTATAKRSTATLTAAEKSTSAQVKLETIREVTAKLSSKEFEGRGTAQPGADKAANYLADRFAKLGLKPGGEGGTFLQPVKFRSAMVTPDSSVKVGDTALKHGVDYVLLPPYASDQLDASGGVVFVGYGVVSKELQRDDLAGLDLTGKVVVMLSGQPKNVDAATWRKAANPRATGMSIFGKGAAALIVWSPENPAQPFSVVANYMSRRSVTPVGA